MVHSSGRLARTGAVALALVLVAAACSVAEEQLATTIPAGTATIDEGPGSSVAATSKFRAFVDQSWNALAIRDPEGLTEAGVSETFGLRDDQLNDLSMEFVTETKALEVATLEELHGFDPSSLSADEQITYLAYEWYLENQVAGHQFWLHDWPIHFFITSYNQGLIGLFTETHPLNNLNQVDDYIGRVRQVERQVDQVIESLEAAEAAGIYPPRYLINPTIEQLRGDLANGDPKRTELYARLQESLRRQGVTRATLGDKTAEVEEALEVSFFPAWEELIAHLHDIEARSHDAIGLYRLPNGDEFYAHKLASHTSTSLSPSQIHDLGLEEIERVQSDLRALFDELGYPAEASLGELRERASAEAGFVAEDEIVAEYERIIKEAETVFAPHFISTPSSGVIVTSYPGQGAFYISPTVDGSRPGSFHVGTGGGRVSSLTMPTIAYHEAIPGHHFQIALAQESDLPAVQRFVTPAGYVEGWALYSERLAADIGAYDGDPYGDIGRLELELLRAARLVVDTGIHWLGWTHDEAKAAMSQIMGNNRYAHEIDRYVAYPAQATAYMIGMLTFLDLREQMSQETADGFDLAEFHEMAIGSGNLPLEVLTRSVSRQLGES